MNKPYVPNDRPFVPEAFPLKSGIKYGFMV